MKTTPKKKPAAASRAKKSSYSLERRVNKLLAGLPDGAREGSAKEIDAAVADAAMEAHKILAGVTPPSAQNVLELAAYGIVSQGNLRDMASGERSMRRTVAAFNALTGNALSERDGWLFMAVVKAARSVYGAHNADDYQDGAAYFALAGECAGRVAMENQLALSSAFVKESAHEA